MVNCASSFLKTTGGTNAVRVAGSAWWKSILWKRPIRKRETGGLTCNPWLPFNLRREGEGAQLSPFQGICGCFCTEKWPNPTSRRVYTMVVMIGQFVLPFIVMAFCYATIFSRLRNRAKVRTNTLILPPPASPTPNQIESLGIWEQRGEEWRAAS